MVAGMSSTTTDGSLAARGCPKSDILGRQPRRTDVVPDISFPLSLKEGGPRRKQYRYRLAVSERHRCDEGYFPLCWSQLDSQLLSSSPQEDNCWRHAYWPLRRQRFGTCFGSFSHKRCKQGLAYVESFFQAVGKNRVHDLNQNAFALLRMLIFLLLGEQLAQRTSDATIHLLKTKDNAVFSNRPTDQLMYQHCLPALKQTLHLDDITPAPFYWKWTQYSLS